MSEVQQPQEKSFLATMLLCWFLGVFGIHRFYTGYIVIGIVQLLTLGGCGIWALLDLVSICLGNYKDVSNRELSGYNRTVGVVVLVIVIVSTVLSVISKMGSN